MKHTNVLNRLQGRLKNYADTINRSWPQDSKVRQRCETGGYHRPGSLKK